MTRSKAAQILFADAVELDRLINEAELPEEFISRFDGGVEETTGEDFRFALENSQLLTIDTTLISGTGDAEDDATLRYRRNFCQRLVGGTFIRLAVFRSQGVGGRIRDREQRALLEWFGILERAISDYVQHDTRQDISATAILIFDRPLAKSDILFLRQLAAIKVLQRIYVMTERMRVTGEGRGLVHSRYVWPRAVGPLLARLVSEPKESQHSQNDCKKRTELLAWRACMVPSALDRAALRRGKVDEINRIFRGIHSKSMPGGGGASGYGEDWIGPRDAPVAGPEAVDDPPKRSSRELGDSYWSSEYVKARVRFNRARLSSSAIDASGSHQGAERAFWVKVSRDPKALLEGSGVPDRDNSKSSVVSQLANAHSARERMRGGELAVANAQGAAREWDKARDACVTIWYRIACAALPVVMLLGLPAFIVFQQVLGSTATFIAALVCAVLGAAVGVYASHEVERRRLAHADKCHSSLCAAAVKLRWEAVVDASRVVTAAEDSRQSDLQRNAAEHRKRLIDRADALMSHGIRDARFEHVEKERDEFGAFDEREWAIAREDQREYAARCVMELLELGVSGSSSARSPTGVGTDGADISGGEVDNADIVAIATDITADWRAEVRGRDLRHSGYLPARWLRLFVARLARKFRFNEAEREEEKARKALSEDQDILNRVSKLFSRFCQNTHQVIGERYEAPLLSVEYMRGHAPQKKCLIVASDCDIAQKICEAMQSESNSGQIRLSAAQGKVFHVGAGAIYFEEIPVILDRVSNDARSSAAVEEVSFRFDEAGAEDDSGSAEPLEKGVP